MKKDRLILMRHLEIKSLFCLILISLLFASIGFAQETVTTTTYYPSPYGAYERLDCEQLWLRKADRTSQKLAFNQDNSNILRVNQNQTFAYTRFDNPVTMDEGLSVGNPSLIVGDGDLVVQNDITLAGDLYAARVFVDDDIRIDDEVQMRYSGSEVKFLDQDDGHIKFNTSDGGYKGMLYRKWYGSGDYLCAPRYYAMPDPGACTYDVGSDKHLVCYNTTGYMLCIRNAD